MGMGMAMGQHQTAGMVNDSFQAMTGGMGVAGAADSSNLSAIPHGLNSDPYIESANLVQVPTSFLVLG